MVMNFWGKQTNKGGSGHGGGGNHGQHNGDSGADPTDEEKEPMLPELSDAMQSYLDNPEGQWTKGGADDHVGDVELAATTKQQTQIV